MCIAVTAETCLFNDFPRTVRGRRITPAAVSFTLQGIRDPTETRPRERSFNVPWDERDRRMMFIFDGDIPSGSLPRNAAVAYSFKLGHVVINVHNAYKALSQHEEPVFYTVADEEEAALHLRRHFLLLPSGSAMVRTYKANFQPKYMEVNVKGGIMTVRKVNTY